MTALATLDTFQEIDQRRSMIEIHRNPKAGLDYSITLDRALPLSDIAGDVILTIRYIPDHFVATPESLDAYSAHLAAQDWSSLENLAATLIDDLNNELIPRWIEVCLKTTLAGGETGYEIRMEDRRPDWTRQVPLIS